MAGRGATVLAAVTLTVLAVGCSSTVPHTRARPSTSSTPSTPTTTRTAVAAPLAPWCRARDLRVRVVLAESVMSQPFLDLTVRNTGSSPCIVEGYPRVRARGLAWRHRAGASPGPVPLRLRHGIIERRDLGPRPVLLAPHDRALFSLGTEDAYVGPELTLTRLTVRIPHTGGAFSLRTHLFANAPPGHRVPMGMVALHR